MCQSLRGGAGGEGQAVWGPNILVLALNMSLLWQGGRGYGGRGILNRLRLLLSLDPRNGDLLVNLVICCVNTCYININL